MLDENDGCHKLLKSDMGMSSCRACITSTNNCNFNAFDCSHKYKFSTLTYLVQQ